MSRRVNLEVPVRGDAAAEYHGMAQRLWLAQGAAITGRRQTGETTMLIRKPADIVPSEITDEAVWRSRRELMLRAGLTAAAVGLPGWATRSAFAQDAGCLLYTSDAADE